MLVPHGAMLVIVAGVMLVAATLETSSASIFSTGSVVSLTSFHHNAFNFIWNTKMV